MKAALRAARFPTYCRPTVTGPHLPRSCLDSGLRGRCGDYRNIRADTSDYVELAIHLCEVMAHGALI
jgi:hypothetical protein